MRTVLVQDHNTPTNLISLDKNKTFFPTVSIGSTANDVPVISATSSKGKLQGNQVNKHHQQVHTYICTFTSYTKTVHTVHNTHTHLPLFVIN